MVHVGCFLWVNFAMVAISSPFGVFVWFYFVGGFGFLENFDMCQLEVEDSVWTLLPLKISVDTMNLAMKHFDRSEWLFKYLRKGLIFFVLLVRLVVCFDGFVFYVMLYITCLFLGMRGDLLFCLFLLLCASLSPYFYVSLWCLVA